MTARIIGGVTVDLADGPIATRYDRDALGKQRAVLVIGDGSHQVGITVSGSSSETLAQLQEAVAELAAETARQQRLANLTEVAA